MMKRMVRWAIGIGLTLLLCWGAWSLWNEVPRLLRRTELSDFSYVASLAAVIVFLSVANPVLGFVWRKLDEYL